MIIRECREKVLRERLVIVASEDLGLLLDVIEMALPKGSVHGS